MNTVTVKHGYIKDLPNKLRDELKILQAEKPGDAWKSVVDPFVPLILGIMLAVTTAILIGYYYVRVHGLIGFVNLSTEMAIILCLYGLFVWAFVFVAFRNLRYWGRNAYCITSFGLVKVLGNEIKVYPYKSIGNTGHKYGTKTITYFDPSTGRTSLTYSSSEQRDREMSGLSGKIASGGGLNGAEFFKIFLKNGQMLEISFSNDEQEEAANFSRKLQEMVGNPPDTAEHLESLNKHFWPPWLRFLSSCLFVVIMTFVLGKYVLIPIRNHMADTSYSRIYLYDCKEQKIENLTNNEFYLEKYMDHFRGPFKAKNWDKVKAKVLVILQQNIDKAEKQDRDYISKINLERDVNRQKNIYMKYKNLKWNYTQE